MSGTMTDTREAEILEGAKAIYAHVNARQHMDRNWDDEMGATQRHYVTVARMNDNSELDIEDAFTPDVIAKAKKEFARTEAEACERLGWPVVEWRWQDWGQKKYWCSIVSM